MMNPADFLLPVTLLIGLVIGLLAGWLLTGRSARLRLDDARAAAETRVELARAALEERIRGLDDQLDALRSERDRANGQLAELTHVDSSKTARIRELETRLADRERNYEENDARLKAVIADTEKRFTDAFKSLAGQILDEKTAKFTETNRTRLDELLNPFRERLQEFQKKIEDTHLAEMQGQSSLKTQVDNLLRLNQQVSEDAKNLTTALKGETKTQGNWGELILERALEMSGLNRGSEYEVQESRTTDEGNRQRPDVVIRLPENRHLIIDSKVSLVAYERFCNAEADADRAAALAEHLLSIRSHIRGLGDRNYPAAYGLDSVDFVLLFVPVEPALLAALREKPDLYEEALQKDIVLVSPANLLATLRVVNHIWRLERQNRNVEEIAKLGALLYDGFVGFVEELEKVRRAVGSAGQSVDAAFQQLRDGRTNLIRRAERLQELGVKTRKRLPASVADTDDETGPTSG